LLRWILDKTVSALWSKAVVTLLASAILTILFATKLEREARLKFSAPNVLADTKDAPADPGAPRRLSDLQKDQITQALRARTGVVRIESYEGVPDSHELAKDFGAAFRAAEWEALIVTPVTVKMPMGAPSTGIAIELPGENGPQPNPKMSDAEVRAVIGGAMAAAGIPVDIRSRVGMWDYGHCCIVIGRRPS
jgi:hypothetical protein